MLFVLAVDLLRSLVNKAKDQGLLKLPIPMEFTQDFPIVHYADDTPLIMEGWPSQLLHLKSLLEDFLLWAKSKLFQVYDGAH